MTVAQLVARVRHPNLARMLPLPGGAGLAPVLGDSKRLADVSSRSAPFRRFPVEQAVRLLLDVLSGLSSLHELVVDGKAFVHGAVSPQQIYIGARGAAQLVPLVSAHMMPSAAPEPTGYVAPELLLGDLADARADLFSVGVMLWEILAGRRMFADPSAGGVVALLVGGKLPRLSPPARAPWARPLCTVAERATAVDPASRYADAAELMRAITEAGGEHLSESANHPWQEEAPTLQRPPLRAVTPAPTVIDVGSAPPATSAPTLAPPEAAVPRRRVWLIALALPAAAAGWLLLAPAAHPLAPTGALEAPPAAAALEPVVAPPVVAPPVVAAAVAPPVVATVVAPPAPASASAAAQLPSPSASAISSSPAAVKATPPKPGLRRSGHAPRPIADYGI